ncbi:MAG: hypothetical protein KBA49_07840 [Methanolinea sp.]|nr:hypothetical protein [Methanolinea sp.]
MCGIRIRSERTSLFLLGTLFLRGYPLAGPGGRLSSHQGILMTSRKELVNEAVLW